MLQKPGREKIIVSILVSLFMLAVAGINYATGGDAPPVKELSLQEAVYLATVNNPGLEVAVLGVEKARVADKGAQFTAENLDIKYVNSYETGLLKWVTPVSTRVALEIAQKSKELTENGLKLSVEGTYYGVLKAERNLAIKRETLKYFQDQLKIAQTAYKIGTKAKIDVTIIESGVASYQALVTSEENNYRAAVMELNRIIGLDLDTPLKLTTQFNADKISGTVKLDDTLKQALANNFEIHKVKQEAEVKKVQYEVAQKFYGGGSSIYDAAQIDTKIAAASIRKQELATTAVVKESYLSLFTLEKMIDWQTKKKAVLADVSIHSKFMVGKFGIDLNALDDVGVAALTRACEEADVVVIDEVGKMEVESEKFVAAVKAALDVDKPIILTLHKKSRNPLLQDIRRRDDIRILEVTPINRNLLPYKIMKLMKGELL